MKRGWVVGLLAVVVALLLLAPVGTLAQKGPRQDVATDVQTRPALEQADDDDEGGGHRVGRVEVVNFPSPQSIDGAVDVRNLPETQQVAGTVSVDNLPLDEEGNLKVSANSNRSVVRFVGFTSHLPHTTHALEASRACNAAFPESRVCEFSELVKSIPPPPPFPAPGAALVTFTFLVGPVTTEVVDTRCVLDNGDPVLGGCGSININELPAACCSL